MVRREPLVARQSEARLVHLARSGTRRRPAEQLDQRHGRPRMGVGRSNRPILPAHLPHGASRPQLAEPGGHGGNDRRDALLARPRRRRLPHRRAVAHRESGRAARQSGEPGLARRHGREAARLPGSFHRPAGGTRLHPPHAQTGGQLRRDIAGRRDLPAARPPDALVWQRRRARRPSALQFRADREPLGSRHAGAPHRGLRRRHSRTRLAQLGDRQPRRSPHRRAGRRAPGARRCHATPHPARHPDALPG